MHRSPSPGDRRGDPRYRPHSPPRMAYRRALSPGAPRMSDPYRGAASLPTHLRVTCQGRLAPLSASCQQPDLQLSTLLSVVIPRLRAAPR